MRRAVIAVLGVLAAFAVGTATANAESGQSAAQLAASGQAAAAIAAAGQLMPTNTAVGIRVLSPGDDGEVSQSNDASAGAAALNMNGTAQSVDQSQGVPTAAPASSCACQPAAGTQVAGQSSMSGQSAEAGALAVQEKPTNTAVGIRVLSPGDDGEVSQANSADAKALAANGNLTGQSVGQSQAGAGTQVAGQSSMSGQSAGAGALAVQEKPTNTAVGIRVLSPGDDGEVSQSNDASAGAAALNGNLTGQSVGQSQAGAGTQVAGQSSMSGQSAGAGALAVQEKPTNTAVGIRVLSPGDDG